MGTIEIKDEGEQVFVTVHDGGTRYIDRVSGQSYQELNDAFREVARLSGIKPAAMAMFAVIADASNSILTNSRNEVQKGDASVALGIIGGCAAVLGKAWRASKGR
jgi:hypothetical protein